MRILIVAVLLLLAIPSYAAIAVDGTSTTGTDATNELTFTKTCSGSDRLLLVGVGIRSETSTVSGITYHGTSMSFVNRQVRGGGNLTVELWRLIAPDTGGAWDVVVSLTGSEDVAAGAISFTGTHQTTPLGTETMVDGADTSSSINVSSATGELVVDFLVVAGNPAPTITVDVSQVERFNVAGSLERLVSSTEAGATTVAMSHTWTGDAAYFCHIGAAVKPAAAAAVPGLTQMFRRRRG